jgi:hypothetical protein
MTGLAETIVYVRITQYSWSQGKIAGEIEAGSYQWQFQWRFREKKLLINPTLGRSLILEPFSRFLERYDYQLELGGDYQFTIKAQF